MVRSFFYASGNGTEQKKRAFAGDCRRRGAVAGVVVCGHGMVSLFTVRVSRQSMNWLTLLTGFMCFS